MSTFVILLGNSPGGYDHTGDGNDRECCIRRCGGVMSITMVILSC
jgi:hypothetical protein